MTHILHLCIDPFSQAYIGSMAYIKLVKKEEAAGAGWQEEEETNQGEEVAKEQDGLGGDDEGSSDEGEDSTMKEDAEDIEKVARGLVYEEMHNLIVTRNQEREELEL